MGAVNMVMLFSYMKKHAVFWLWMILLPLWTGCAGTGPTVSSSLPEKTALDMVLEALFLESNDVVAEKPNGPNNSFLLQKTAFLLEHPLEFFSFAAGVSSRVQASSNRLSDLAALSADLLEVPVVTDGPSEPEYNDMLPVTGIHPAIGDLYRVLARGKRLHEEAFEEMSEDDAGFVKGMFEQMLFYGIHQSNRTRIESQNRIERAIDLASRIDLRKIARACYDIAHLLDMVLPELIRESGVMPLGSIDTPLGTVVVGGSGDDVYEGPMPFILIDPAGDDSYRFSDHAPFHIIIDLAGDDVYVSSESVYPGSGILGLGFLLDVRGDDLYEGRNFVSGCGFMGAGFQADFEGNDRYRGDAFCQGAAALGMGLLYDGRGDDVYENNIYGQGMGYIGGVGMLADIHGDDLFRAGFSVADGREAMDAYQTYAQGFGLGSRLFASGGIGVLYNGSGNDMYTGSYFCQGSSTWQALGMLIDRSGDDTYQARRYAQGAGIHASLGVLLDQEGADRYTSWGVSQGCGHDYAAGILWDRQGSDRYEAEWLSQGAGNSMGVGMLVDEYGTDVYAPEKIASGRGGGVYDKRRNAVSVGILLDGAGQLDPGGEDQVWTRGDIGGGIESTGTTASIRFSEMHLGRFHGQTAGVTDTAKASPGVAFDLEYVLPELERPLFLDDSWQEAAGQIAAQGPSVIPALCNYLAIKDVSVQRTIEETLKKLAEHHLEAIHAFLLRPDTSSKAKRFLLFVLGEIARADSRDVFVRFLGHDSAALQAMALRGLHLLESPPPSKRIAEMSLSENKAVRRYLCLALRYAPGEEGLEILVRLLADHDFQVRYAALRVLQDKSEPAKPYLKELLERKGLPPTVYRMAETLHGRSE